MPHKDIISVGLMAKVSIPVADQTVDTDKPADSFMRIVLLMVGFTVLFVTATFGQNMGNRVARGIMRVLGVEQEPTMTGVV